MSGTIKNAVAEYYTGKLKIFGATPRGVDWNSEQSQKIRFDQLCKILPADLSSVSLLDFGCGYGALYEFLRKEGAGLSYSGYDVSEEMIRSCKTMYPTAEAIFFTDDKLLSTHDFTIASGIFNVKMEFSNENWKTYILETLETINRVSTKGFSFNMLTSYSDKEFMKDNLYYADPSFFFDHCKRNFSRQVALLHDYQLYEFSILVRK